MTKATGTERGSLMFRARHGDKAARAELTQLAKAKQQTSDAVGAAATGKPGADTHAPGTN